MNAEGMKEAMYQAYVPGEHDYSALVSRLKEAGINLIYFGGYHTETGLIVRQAKEQGLKATLIGRRLAGRPRSSGRSPDRPGGRDDDLPLRPARPRRQRRRW